jgi:type I restriction enzyme S subunit
MSEATQVPQLRFPEFSGEWEEKKLSDVTSIVMGQSPDSTSYNSNSTGLYLIQGNADIKKRKTSPRVWTDAPTKECKVGDIIMTVRAPVGAVAKSIHNACIGRGVCAVRSNQYSVSNYIYQFLLNFENKWAKFEQGTTFTAVNTKDVKSLKLSLPTRLEQQKIAAFLTAVDTKIEQLSKKQELLGEYKKGLAQQIFSQAIRFKADDGSDFPDWEEKRLGDLTYKVGKKNKENIQYPIYSINNQEGFRPQSEQFDGLDSNDRGYDISLYKVVNEKTFAYNPARINVGSIGYSYNLNKVIISSLYVCFKTNDELEDLYLLAYLDTDKFNKDILRYEEGGVRQYLFYENFSQISIPLPGNDEQTKIANFLSSIDNKIEQVGKQLDESRQFKKALLQQMFV